MRELVAMVADGRLTLPVDSVPFADIDTAHERLDAKHARGKTVLDLSDNAFLPAAGDR